MAAEASNLGDRMTEPIRAGEQQLPKIEEPVDQVSLVRGGPFYRAQAAVRLVDSKRWNLGKRILLGVAVGWIPIVILTLSVDPSALLSLLSSYAINSRMLIAVPVLLAGQPLMESIFLRIGRHITDADLLSPSDSEQLKQTVAKLRRWRDSSLPEIVIVVIAYSYVAGSLHSHFAIALPWALTGTGAAAHLSPAGWYVVLVSQPLYQLLLGISLWKWLLWTIFLFKLSRLDTKLVATHPDKHGGLGFLGISPLAIAPTVFAISTVIGSTWRIDILREGMHLINLKSSAAALLVILLSVAFGPLILFVPKLAQLRRKGILDYGVLGQIHSTEFDEKWVQHRAGHEQEFLTAPEISSLIDFSSSYVNVEALQPFPFDKESFLSLVMAIAIPLLPVVLAEIPLVELLKGLLRAVK